ncbi:MAG: DUF11 domain-containing protein [Deltaproteobacteria bacterium]|nr:DUF11 domain-containing protein [Deltaproteobacteria bacterium]
MSGSLQRLFLSLVLLPVSLVAGEYGANRNQQQFNQLSEAGRTLANGNFTLLGYNRIQKPQFSLEEVSAGDLIYNGGVGTGSGNSYFCSGEDEANEYRRLHPDLEINSQWNPNSGFEDYGQYKILRLVDHCRTGSGCGDLIPDGKTFLVGIPLHATNCHPLGRQFVRDGTGWGSSTNLRQRSDDAWQGRNYIDDGHFFTYGRYLINQLSENLSGAALRTEAYDELSVSITSGDVYSLGGISPNYLDLPYSSAHLQWGFTCSQAFRAGGYRKSLSLFPRGNSLTSKTVTVRQAEAERGLHYRTLLEYATNRLGHKINHGEYGVVRSRIEGDLKQGLSTEEREMREIVVNIWRILDEIIGDVEWEPCTGDFCWIRAIAESLYGPKIRIKRCAVARGSIVDYQHDEARICIKSEVFNDCQSKRTNNSHPFYNTGGVTQGSSCTPSYGEKVDGGLYIRNWEVDRGYQLRDVGSHMGAIRGLSGYLPADGYSPVIVSLIAHQLVHAYFQRELDRNRMNGWPNSPESLWEEELAVMAQAIVFDLLRQMDYVDSTFKMKKEEFTRSIQRETPGDTSTGVVDTTSGVRYFYPDECRGYGGIFLGPFCANMRNIHATLANQDNPELGRMMALFHSLAPIFDLPNKMTFNGVEIDVRESRPSDSTTSASAEHPRWVTASADLAVSLETNPVRVDRGGTLMSTVHVRNVGPDRVEQASLSITLPAALSYVSSAVVQTGGGECSHFPAVNRLFCDLGSVEGAQIVDVNFTIIGSEEGSYAAIIEVDGSIADLDTSNNEQELQIVVGPPLADLQVNMDSDPLPTYAVGNPVLYVVVVENLGPEAALNVSLVFDDISNLLTFNSVNMIPSSAGDCYYEEGSGVIFCGFLGSVAPGASFTISIEMTPLGSGTHITKSVVSSDSNDLIDGNNQSTNVIEVP